LLRLKAFRARRGEWKGPEVNASIGEGSVVALVGPNGSGKTSTLLAVAGLLEREGSVEIDGVELSSIDRRTLRSIVLYVPEDPTSYVVRNYVLDEVLAGPEFLDMDPKEALRRSLEALEAVGLRERADDPVEHLSGGQLQRLVMACSLVTSPCPSRRRRRLPSGLGWKEGDSRGDRGGREEGNDRFDRCQRPREVAPEAGLGDRAAARPRGGA
jgi:energy-coupling factor transporter ATP-binding protein EcfA2